QKEIRESVAHLKELVEVLPSMYERARGVLPRDIDEVGYQYAQAKNKGVYTEHLEVRKNLDIISDMLKNDLNKL
ncbi:septation ring formation regulator EzrA, partial [Desulfovibrio desulfuricans]|nr:septation ring formation regulator EzrA [Desulfovibrio desulfuricans]